MKTIEEHLEELCKEEKVEYNCLGQSERTYLNDLATARHRIEILEERLRMYQELRDKGDL